MGMLAWFIVPLLAILIGLPLGIALVKPVVTRDARSWALPMCLVLVCVATAPQLLGQQLYELGMSFRAIDVAKGVCYFVFFTALAGAWMLVGRNRFRFALLVVVPIALLEPLKDAFAFACWSVNGFAP